MAGLVAYSAAGLGLLALAALESLPLRLPPLPLVPRRLSTPLHARHLLAALLSALCLLSALFSAHHLSLPTLGASALFLLYSLAPFAPLAAPLPLPLLDLLLAAAFAQELLLFAHRRQSTAAGIENRYFDLFLVPITVCLGATLLAAHRPDAAPPRLARAAGLALQGTWMMQMGFSFFTNAIANGCTLHAESRVDYTIKCRTHEDYHRARSVATLQFNGHLALLVLAGAAAYAAVLSSANSPPSGYRMLGKEVQMEGMAVPSSQFTLDSDDEKEDEGISTPAATPVANGVHSHHQITLHAPESN
ncbi:uncharacterized protein LOC100824667 [Brachypodium distachyon]|uniref:Uncharacterized protein n=1 Tax=Brachypodium distachyon TaxID=15368 RepID=I1GZE5_BRADI|nr:uncharacterized protein LOC100824667 [Brachypodium distachyon]KQK18792.1 hypothetical protein BRADI_1g44710v3 [Brachypodium distachyon]|eukprot:XP_003564020.1 uncharacterized protein LOC100824667 [Brachypodium distachyon]